MDTGELDVQGSLRPADCDDGVSPAHPAFTYAGQRIPDACGLIPRARSHLLAIRRPADIQHHILMARTDTPLFPRAHFVDLYACIIATRRDVAPVRRPGHTHDTSRVGRITLYHFQLVHVPNPDGMITATIGDLLSIGRLIHAIHQDVGITMKKPVRWPDILLVDFWDSGVVARKCYMCSCTLQGRCRHHLS